VNPEAVSRRSRETASRSLSEDLRNELAAIAPVRRCCQLAELSALFHASGAWHLREGAVRVHLDLGGAAAARRAFALLRDVGVRSEVVTYRRAAFDRATRYELHVDVDEQSLAVLREAGVLSTAGAPLQRPPKRVVGRSCCRGAYLRGALLAAGSLSGPDRVHLELRAAELAGARFVADVAAAEDVRLRVAERRSHALAYAKGNEAVAAVLALAGAGETTVRLEEHAVLAATRADANRLANADEANLVRTARAAHAQLEAIRRLDVDALPPALAEIAGLRLRYPAAALRELAARTQPRVTKATAYRRLRAVVDLADK